MAKKPGDSASGTKPGSSTTKPGTGTPAKPGTGVPAKPGTGTPSRPGTGMPTKPGAVTPVKQAAPKPTTAPKQTMTADRAEREAMRNTPSMPSGINPLTDFPVVTTTNTRTSGGATVVENPAAIAQDKQFANWEEAAKELYGGYYSIVQSVPELQDLLRKAYDNKWSDSRFEYELKQTTWWKQNSGTARQWDLQSQSDPASAEQQITARVAEMRNMVMSNYQVDLTDAQLRKLATDSLRGGWTQQMVMNAIGIEAVRTGQGLSQIATGFLGQGLRATANEYGVVLSDDSFNKWVSDIATGKETKETFQQYALNTAKTLFPALSQQLDAGATFQQIIDPYKNVASQLLEINPNEINFLDPRWAKAVSFTDGGQQRMMNFNEWSDYLRQDRSFGYEFTSDAQAKAYQVANNLANLFGKV